MLHTNKPNEEFLRVQEMANYFEDKVGIQDICDDIGKSETEFEEEVQQLKKWFTEQKHLPQSAMDEVAVQKFLIGMKGDGSRARARLDSYFAVRNFVPHLFDGRDPLSEEILTANNLLYVSILPGLTEDRARVVMVRLRQEDPELMDLTSILKRIFNLLDIWLRTDPFATRVYIVTDTAQVCLGHVLKISPARIREAIYCIQNVYPVRIHGLLFLNVKPFMKTAIDKLLKPLFKRKLAKRVCVYCGDLSDFYKKVPLSLMPSDYGGGSPSLETLNQTWINHVNQNREWLLTAGSIKSDEALREGKCPVSGPGCLVM